MTREEAAKILDPETTLDTYAKISYYGGFEGENVWQDAVNEACRMGAEALRALDAQEKQESFGEWISVKDGLPEPFVSVLGYMPDAAPFPEVRECYCTGDSDKKFFVPALSERHEISHWAELPKPPKEEHHE